ncbi:MAG TPA: hypothetical protein DCO86_04935 [Spirochaetaceae bacterium]|nr:hypothetical protein [Spirochaetaceae bacterium]
MGRRGEIFSSKLVRDRRTYFFNVHENFGNALSLSIVESKNTVEENVFQRQSVLVFQEDLDDFLKEMQKAIDVLKQEKMNLGVDDEKSRSISDHGREVRIDEINKKPSSARIESRMTPESQTASDRLRKKRIMIRRAKDEQ